MASRGPSRGEAVNADWERISGLFADALELDEHERQPFLAGACAGDGRVKREIERLLAESAQLGDFIERPVFADIRGSEEDPWIGQILNNRYGIERFVARGGAGTVYLAHDRQLADRSVIVKFMHAWAREDPWLKKRFRQEMEALARIDHYGVVGVLDTGQTSGGLPFLVMEYVDGIILRSAMQPGGMETGRVARLIQGIGHAAAAAHAKGVVHRDLKPENIMLEWPGTAAETVRLIDFGIARVEGSNEEIATQITQFAGTTPYMAPEHLMGKPVPASDTYAIAVIAYEMLTGRRPFPACGPVELYQQQRSGVRTDPRKLRPELPDAAARLILRGLSFRPEDRAATAAEAGESLASALLGPRREGLSRRRAAAIIAGAAAVGGGIRWWSKAWWSNDWWPNDWWWNAWWPNEKTPSLAAAERVIEYPGGAEPLECGFVKDLDIVYHSLQNTDASGLDSIRVSTGDQGSYFHRLTPEQSRVARRAGWRLKIEAAVDQGSLNAVFDAPNFPNRYILNILRESDGRDVARLVTAIRTEFKGIDWVLPGTPGTRHQFELVMNPLAAQADLWVDGVKRLAGYQGMNSFRYGRGMVFGAARYRSQRATGVFWSARLEIGGRISAS